MFNDRSQFSVKSTIWPKSTRKYHYYYSELFLRFLSHVLWILKERRMAQECSRVSRVSRLGKVLDTGRASSRGVQERTRQELQVCAHQRRRVVRHLVRPLLAPSQVGSLFHGRLVSAVVQQHTRVYQEESLLESARDSQSRHVVASQAEPGRAQAAAQVSLSNCA